MEQPAVLGLVVLHGDVVGERIGHVGDSLPAVQDGEIAVDIVLKCRVAKSRRPQHVNHNQRHRFVELRRYAAGPDEDGCRVKSTNPTCEILDAIFQAEAP